MHPLASEHLAHALQHVAERHPVLTHLDLGETYLLEQRSHRFAVVSAEMADELVSRRVAVLMRRNRQQQPAARPQPLSPRLQRPGVVLNVLQHLESADQVEALLGVECLDRHAAHLAQSAERETLFGHRV